MDQMTAPSRNEIPKAETRGRVPSVAVLNNVFASFRASFSSECRRAQRKTRVAFLLSVPHCENSRQERREATPLLGSTQKRHTSADPSPQVILPVDTLPSRDVPCCSATNARWSSSRLTPPSRKSLRQSRLLCAHNGPACAKTCLKCKTSQTNCTVVLRCCNASPSRFYAYSIAARPLVVPDEPVVSAATNDRKRSTVPFLSLRTIRIRAAK